MKFGDVSGTEVLLKRKVAVLLKNPEKGNEDIEKILRKNIVEYERLKNVALLCVLILLAKCLTLNINCTISLQINFAR
jgi:hypothetical protein